MAPNISRRGLLGSALAVAGTAALPVAGAGTDPIAQRIIPASGEALPVIGVGTARTFDVGDDPREREIRGQVLRALLDGGGTLVDSSPMYGSAEEVIGNAIAGMPDSDRLFLTTKVWTRGRQEGIEQMRRSLDQLGAQRVDLMQIHNLLEWRTHAATLRDWKESGRIRYMGISHYRKDAYPEVIDTIRRLREPVEFLQINYSLLSPEAADEVLPLAADEGMAVLVNRPFDNGEAFRRVSGRPLPEWAGEIGIRSWAQYFLKYILANPAVTCVITGTSRPSHMAENLQAARGELPDAATATRMRNYVLDL